MLKELRKSVHVFFLLIGMQVSFSSPQDLASASKLRLIVKTKTAFALLDPQSEVSKRVAHQSPQIRAQQSFKSREGLMEITPPFNHYATLVLPTPSAFERTYNELLHHPEVLSVQPDYELSDPSFEETAYSDPALIHQYHLKALKMDEVWKLTQGKGIRIADVESGFDLSHPDLEGQVDLQSSQDYDTATEDPNDVEDHKKTHGTPTLGLIAAILDNHLFGAGMAPQATLIASQMANDYTTEVSEALWTVNTAQAIVGSVYQGADVILVEKQIPLLQSTVLLSQVIFDAIDWATSQGVVVVIPAGNFNQPLEKEALLKDSGAIIVGSRDQQGTPSAFSNWGPMVHVSAYGEKIYSIQQNNSQTQSFGGTSAASAMVAAASALLLERDPHLTPHQVRRVLMSSARRMIEEEKNVGGLIAPVEAIKQIEEKKK